MKSLILFAGLPGTGKSHAARILKDKIASYYFDSDKFAKDVSMKGFDFKNASDSELLMRRVESQKQKIKLLKELFNHHDVIILDTCLDLDESRDLYFELENMVRVIVLEVVCSEKTVRERILGKEHEHERMVGTREGRWDVYKKMKKDWKEIKWKNYFVIDSDKNVESQLCDFVDKFGL